MPIAIRTEMFLTNKQVSPVSSTAENVEQHVYFVEKNRKRNLLYHLIKNQDLSDVLVFSRTKHGADNVVKALRKTVLQLRPYMVINLRMQDSECWRL
jgi:ATP-dependent RNA helicase RhlE